MFSLLQAEARTPPPSRSLSASSSDGSLPHPAVTAGISVDSRQPQPGQRKVFIAMDHHPHSQNAFRFYLKFLRQDNDFLYFGHTRGSHTLYATPPDFEEFERNQRICTDLGIASCSAAHVVGLPSRYFYLMASGHPTLFLWDLVTALKIDLVVVGSRGPGRAAFRSVSYKFSKIFTCPVCIVPPASVLATCH